MQVKPGKPVDYYHCIVCGRELRENDERWRGEKDGKVGVKCASC